LLALSEWDWISAQLTTLPATTATRLTTNAYNITTLVSPLANGSCGTSAADSNAYWTFGLGPVLNAKVASGVTNSSGILQQVTQFGYDNALTTANVTQESDWRSRGNSGSSVSPPSTITSSLSSAAITAHTYGWGGALASTTDPNGNQTQYNNYACTAGSPGNYNGIYPSSIVLANGFQATLTWDCNAGLVIGSSDPNSVPTSNTLDNLGRNTLVQVGAATRDTRFTYNEPACSGSPCIVTSATPVTVTTNRDLATTGDGEVVTTRTLDQRGQTYLIQTSDTSTSSFIYVTKLPKLSAGANTYEAVSNPYRTSNPTGSITTSTDTTVGWTRTIYDQLNRPIEIDHFDGATLPYPWGSSTSPASSASATYNGNATTITDEAGKKKMQTVDGLGRLSSVVEDPNDLAYTTTYTYDIGNNLLGVNQSGQTRTFTYDSLNRLYQAINPESGTVTYTYDANGNLLTRTDARGIVTTMTYDALNRVLSTIYSDGTPAVTYCYDGATSGNCGSAPTGSDMKGRVTMVSSSASVTEYTGYDEFGDVTASQQITGGTTYAFSYSYNKLSEITSMTYPSGRIVQTAYDNAGRPTCVTAQSLGTCGPTTAYASSITYAANNGVSSMTLGNSLVQATTFNTRFQPTAIRAGSLLTLGFSYGTGSNGTASNNGNLLSQTITASSGLTGAITQFYTYDNVNRLSTFSETGSTANQNYSYDAFGNRYQPGSQFIPYTGQSPTGLNFPNNQWAAGSGVTYDAAGNQTAIQMTGGTTSRPSCASGLQSGVAMLQIACYDAENRMTTAMTAAPVTTTYVYDGAGRRVIKTVGSGPSTVYVYDATGQLTAEYGGPTNPLTGTTYVTGDHLGSTRLVANASASVIERVDYAPFGEELTSGIDGRGAPYSTNQYPTATLDGTSEKFTGQERDAESGMDFFKARYASAPQGRFQSPDPAGMFVADPTNPQSWNLYSYVFNNPLAYIDPSGLDACDPGDASCSGDPCFDDPFSCGVARNTSPAAKVFMEGLVPPPDLFIDERHPVRQMHTHRLRLAQLLVELRRRHQLRPAQPPPMLVQHPPRPVFRHRYEQGQNEERQREIDRLLVEVPGLMPRVHRLAHHPVQATVVERPRHPGQPDDAVLHALVR
jgi:RHS repeat-associated protein